MSEETIASEVLAASIGGAISAGVLFPLEVLKTKIQATENFDEMEETSMLQFARKLYEREGPAVFFRGIETSSFQSALEKALYFFAYTALKTIHQTVTGGAKLDTATNLLMGCAAEWAHLPISLPVDAWTTKIQTSNQAPMAILLSMLSKDNKREWYKGITAYYLLCFKPALQYTIYEQVKAVVLAGRKDKTLTAAEAFVLGSIARTLATLLVFPFLRAKVLMQTSKAETGRGDSASSNSTMDVLWQQWKRAGIGGLYVGIAPELSRGILSSALMLMIKERIAVTVRKFLAPKQQQLLRR